jgi:hypothetical protein
MSGEQPDSKEQVLAEWSYHPLVETPRKSVLLVVLLAVAWATAYFWFQGWGLLMAAALTILPLQGYIFPSHYVLKQSGIEVRNMANRQDAKWSRFVDYHDFEDAVQLYYDSSNLRGRLLKGVLMFYDGNRDEVCRIVEEHIKVEPS